MTIPGEHQLRQRLHRLDAQLHPTALFPGPRALNSRKQLVTPLVERRAQRLHPALDVVDGVRISQGTQETIEIHLSGYQPQPVTTSDQSQNELTGTKKYWYAEQPGAGVKLPAVGVGLKVLHQHGTSVTVKLFKTK